MSAASVKRMVAFYCYSYHEPEGEGVRGVIADALRGGYRVG